MRDKSELLTKLVPNQPNVDWRSILDLFPQLKLMDECPQDPFHHAEGDAGTHTRMVVDSLINGPYWASLNDNDRFRLFWAAVFHDSGKPGTTITESDGRITSAGHSRLGASIARDALRQHEIDLVEREIICALITAHQLPFWLYERADAEKTACQVSLSVRPRDLIAHCTADALGRICSDQQDLLDRIGLSTMVFEDMGILDEQFPFANDESRVAYFEKEERDPWYAAHEDFRCNATVVCGLPGTGKDTWIRANANQFPVVSLDDIRRKMKVSPEDNQGAVIQAGFEQAREHLRARRDFVWNTTNVTRTNREKILRLLRDYDAKINIVYLEVSPERLLQQNAAREMTVPVPVIEKLARKLEPPLPHEGHSVEWYFNGKLARKIGTEKDNQADFYSKPA